MANSRSCIVSRREMEKEALLRFVAGPDNRIYPDLKETLPGRGVWVEARRACVEQAVAKNLFARSLKAQVTAEEAEAAGEGEEGEAEASPSAPEAAAEAPQV